MICIHHSAKARAGGSNVHQHDEALVHIKEPFVFQSRNAHLIDESSMMGSIVGQRHRLPGLASAPDVFLALHRPLPRVTILRHLGT